MTNNEKQLLLFLFTQLGELSLLTAIYFRYVDPKWHGNAFLCLLFVFFGSAHARLRVYLLKRDVS